MHKDHRERMRANNSKTRLRPSTKPAQGSAGPHAIQFSKITRSPGRPVSSRRKRLRMMKRSVTWVR